MYNDNDNDNDLFGDFCSNDQLYGSENNPTTNNDNNPNAYITNYYDLNQDMSQSGDPFQATQASS